MSSRAVRVRGHNPGLARRAGIPGRLLPSPPTRSRRSRRQVRSVPLAGEHDGPGRAGLAARGRRSGHPRHPPPVSRRLCLAGSVGVLYFRRVACGIPENTLDMLEVLFSFRSLLLWYQLNAFQSIKYHLHFISETAYVCLFSFPSDSP